jgi:hypothetical protein
MKTYLQSHFYLAQETKEAKRLDKYVMPNFKLAYACLILSYVTIKVRIGHKTPGCLPDICFQNFGSRQTPGRNVFIFHFCCLVLILDHFALLRACCYREAAVIMSQIHNELNVQLKKNVREALCLLLGEREFFTIRV